MFINFPTEQKPNQKKKHPVLSLERKKKIIPPTLPKRKLGGLEIKFEGKKKTI